MFNNNEKTTKRALAACLFLFMGAILGSTHVGAQIADIPVPGSQAVVILGEIEHVFVDDMDGQLRQEGVELRQVIVDEAGTTPEPEALCPATGIVSRALR